MQKYIEPVEEERPQAMATQGGAPRRSTRTKPKPLAEALAKVEQLKKKLAIEYGQAYSEYVLTAGKQSHGGRADADEPVTQASVQRARRLEVQLTEAQRNLDALMAGAVAAAHARARAATVR